MRLAGQGLHSDRAAVKAMGDAKVVGRDTLAKIYAGTASESSYKAVEAWLDSIEEENGRRREPVIESSPIRVTFHDVTTSSIGEIIVEGSSDHLDELRAMITGLMSDVRKGEGP